MDHAEGRRDRDGARGMVRVLGTVLLSMAGGALISYCAIHSLDREAQHRAMVVPDVFTIDGHTYTFPEGVDELTLERDGEVRK